MRSWGGRRVRALVNLVIATRGDICHLCGLPGADSADHEPPRVELVRSGVPNPDSLVFLFPAHRYPCNITRGARPITDTLKLELRVKRQKFLDSGRPSTDLSPRFRRRFFPPDHDPGRLRLPISPHGHQENSEVER